jgi:hypothetical protein
MWLRIVIGALLTSAFLMTPSFSQEWFFPPEKVDLGFDPAEGHRQLAEGKAGAAERRMYLQEMARSAKPTNWQEYDVTFYDILWHPVHATHTIKGTIGIYFRSMTPSLDSVMIHLTDSLTVDSVYSESGLIAHTHTENIVTVYLDRSYALGELTGFSIVYHGQPPQYEYDWFASLYFRSRKGYHVIESYAEPFTARTWWPCNDIPCDKADSADIRIVADTGLTAVSNGLLISDTDNGDGTHTAYWKERYPITTYLLCLNISNYMQWTDYYHYSPTDSMPIENYYFPDQHDSIIEHYAATPEAITIFADLFGEYPFINEKYGHSMGVVHGMEHQTNTLLNIILTKKHYIIVHELAHHWWGNLVTCRDWHHIWLNEGFGSYCEALLYEQKYGIIFYLEYMTAVENYADGSVYVYDTTDVNRIFSSALSYDKGAWVLHMLRRVVGDSLFFPIFPAYAQEFAYDNAITEDFQAVCENITGMDLDFFFQQWIYGNNYPIYAYATKTLSSPQKDPPGYDTYLHLRQVHDTDPQIFSTPVEFQFWYGSGYTIIPAWNDQRNQNIVIHTTFQPDSIDFDPNNWLLEYSYPITFRLHIFTDSLSNGVQGEDYCDTVVIVSANDEFTADIMAGALPGGWNLDASTGIISGRSFDTGLFTFTVWAYDNIEPGYADAREYTVSIEDAEYTPGDANLDGQVNVGDAVFLVNYIFKGGPAPEIPNFADANADCEINVGDAVYLINYVFKSGPAPQVGCVE